MNNGDLISRSALLAEYNDFKDMDCPSGHTVTADYMIELAEAVPAVDAVEVVRCQNCKWHRDTHWGYVVCGWFGKTMRADAFCSNGSKMDMEVQK